MIPVGSDRYMIDTAMTTGTADTDYRKESLFHTKIFNREQDWSRGDSPVSFKCTYGMCTVCQSLVRFPFCHHHHHHHHRHDSFCNLMNPRASQAPPSGCLLRLVSRSNRATSRQILSRR